MKFLQNYKLKSYRLKKVSFKLFQFSNREESAEIQIKVLNYSERVLGLKEN